LGETVQGGTGAEGSLTHSGKMFPGRSERKSASNCKMKSGKGGESSGGGRQRNGGSSLQKVPAKKIRGQKNCCKWNEATAGRGRNWLEAQLCPGQKKRTPHKNRKTGAEARSSARDRKKKVHLFQQTRKGNRIQATTAPTGHKGGRRVPWLIWGRISNGRKIISEKK